LFEYNDDIELCTYLFGPLFWGCSSIVVFGAKLIWLKLSYFIYLMIILN